MNTKKMIYNVTFFVLTFLVLSSPAFAATYYVDATNGNDNYTGLSKTKAWKTIAKVNVSRFNPGDHILFKRGAFGRSIEMKGKALAQCEIPTSAMSPAEHWSTNPELMAFLKSL